MLTGKEGIYKEGFYCQLQPYHSLSRLIELQSWFIQPSTLAQPTKKQNLNISNLLSIINQSKPTKLYPYPGIYQNESTKIALPKKQTKQAGAELGQAQIKLGLGFTSIKICCIELILQKVLLVSLPPTTSLHYQPIWPSPATPSHFLQLHNTH